METNVNNILCATDFSKHSRAVIDYASALARRFKAHLIVFHAVCLPGHPLYGTARSREADDQEEPIQRARKQIQVLMQQQSISWESVICYGDPVEEVLKLADRRSFELVIAASYGLSGWKRILVGTVVEQLARNIERPLLVVHARKGTGKPTGQSGVRLRNIMISCDLSDQIDLVFRPAFEFARAFGARLHFVHAIEAPVETAVVEPTAAPYGEAQERLKNELHQRLLRRISDDGQARPDMIATVLPGAAEDIINEYARKNDIDLIVVGVRPHGPIEKLLIGSTTEAVLRHAPCEVLTVPLAKIAVKIHRLRAFK
jgi:nucleotide-binding universal stress UspA family protein